MSHDFSNSEQFPLHKPAFRDIVLTIGSALFVIAGLIIAALGGVWPGLACALFFGGCFLVGLHEIAPPGAVSGKFFVICGCFLLGMGGFALALGIAKPFSETQMSGGWRGDTTMVFVGIFCGLFFCLGAIAIAVRTFVDARRIKRQQQWYYRNM